MTRIKAPYIPAPRPHDKEYSELCRRWFDLKKENYALERKLSIWRSYFIVTAELLLVCLIIICMEHIEIIFK